MQPVDVQANFIGLLNELFCAARYYDSEVLLFADPVHQVHNNENDYCWQLKGGHNTKTAFANTGRRRLNIIGAINPVNLQPTIAYSTKLLLLILPYCIYLLIALI